MKSFAGALAGSALLLVALAAACDDPPTHIACVAIPAGGCPRGSGAVCDDPTCAAVYACQPDGTWVFERDCAARDASLDASPDAGDSSDWRDAAIDAPPGASGGPGCEELQPPECPLARALACSNGCCDCQDLFVCENGGWSLWGQCTDKGIIPQ